jgi:16S rRNA (cytosine967-C5)-methyltransferase
MRRRAATILRRVEKGHGFAADLLRGDDAPFVRELVMGVLRRRGTLDAIHDSFSRRPAKELDDDVRQALRIGLYQLIFLDGVPPHAIVSEAVSILGPKSKRAYANGVLRAIQRETKKSDPELDRGGASPTKRFERKGRAVFFFTRSVFPDPTKDMAGWLAAVHSHPVELVRRWLKEVGEERTIARMEAGNVIPQMVLRPRAGRCDAEELAEALRGDQIPTGVLSRESGLDALIVAPGKWPLFSGKAYRKGLFVVQDPLQMDAAEILAPQEGEVIWDACAAPGGKTTQLAEMLQGTGHVVASDVDGSRLKRVEENVERLGLTNISVLEHDALSETPPPGAPSGGFDAVLLDAPCSNTAVLGARPEARWRWTAETPTRMVELQEQLVASARRQLKPGGRLIYSVCTFEPEEGLGHGLSSTRSELVFEERQPQG